MGYTISHGKRLICKDLSLKEALDSVSSDLEDLAENEEITLLIWRES